MALSAHAEDIPLPISGSYGNSHIYHHSTPNHVTPPTSTLPPSNGSINPDHAFPSYKRVMRYKECLKNHAASIGGNATDGCGEFMPAGPEGTLDALKCSACNCHRNFHRKDFHGDTDDACDCYRHLKGRKVGKGILVPTSESYAYPTNGHVPRSPVIMSYNLGVPSESDERQCGGGGMLITTAPILKKRFRTKFTPDQKEKMLGFAERVGWRIQRLEESVVQQFCQEIGIRRRVLKVWMHNNKHNLAKKINNSA